MGKQLHRFSNKGVYQGPLPTKLGRPTDLAAGRGELYVADLDRQAVLAFSGDDVVNPPARIRGLRPVALDHSGGQLAVLDMASHTLGVFSARDGERLRSVPLGRVGLMDSVALDPTGHVLVTQRRKDRESSRPDGTWLLDGAGRILTPDSNPNHLAMALRAQGVERLLAGSLDMSRGRLLILSEWTGGAGRFALRGALP